MRGNKLEREREKIKIMGSQPHKAVFDVTGSMHFLYTVADDIVNPGSTL